MTLRLMAVAALALAGIAFNVIGMVKPDASGVAPDVALLPDSVGAYRRSDTRWFNEDAGQVEEGALYTRDVRGTPAQLDFFRRARTAHNGLACYLMQGETVLWDRVETLKTARGVANFDVGLTQTRESLRLVAAAECSAQACNSTALPILRHPQDMLRVVRDWFTTIPSGSVPVSIVLMAPQAERDPAVEAALHAQLLEFVADLDLGPAQQLATIQQGR